MLNIRFGLMTKMGKKLTVTKFCRLCNLNLYIYIIYKGHSINKDNFWDFGEIQYIYIYIYIYIQGSFNR